MSKRNNEEEDSVSPPLKKVHFDPVEQSKSTKDNLNYKTTEFSKYDNKKLAQLLVQKNQLVAELRNKIIRLDQRETEKDLVSIVIKAINHYWNQWDEDFNILLQKYDIDSLHNIKQQSRRECKMPCLTLIPKIDIKEFSKHLANRQELSKQTVVKVIKVFEKQMEKKEKLALALKGELELDEGEPKLFSLVQDIHKQLSIENQNLQDLNSKLFVWSNDMSSQLESLKRTTDEKETELTKMRNQLKELQNENKKILEQNNQLETQLAASWDKLNTMEIDDETAQNQMKPNYKEDELDKLDILVKKILKLSNSPCIEKNSFDSDDNDDNANNSYLKQSSSKY